MCDMAHIQIPLVVQRMLEVLWDMAMTARAGAYVFVCVLVCICTHIRSSTRVYMYVCVHTYTNLRILIGYAFESLTPNTLVRICVCVS